MIGIRAIATHLPAERIDLVARAAEFGSTPEFIRDKSGFTSVCRMGAGQETSDLCVAAIRGLEPQGLDLAAADCLVVVTQTPDGHGLPHTSAVVHGKLGLAETCAAFDISLGCSGYVYGLPAVSAFMAANGMRNGLLVTADPYSRIMAPGDRATQMLFGDGAAATWLSEDPVLALGPARFGTRGSAGGALAVGAEGHLAMNGRAVFTFSATVVPPFLTGFLADNGLAVGDLDRVFLHQGSRFIVETIRSRIGATEVQAPFCAAETGNLVSSSLPVMLAGRMDEIGARALLCGFGVGLSWGAILLHRNEKETT